MISSVNKFFISREELFSLCQNLFPSCNEMFSSYKKSFSRREEDFGSREITLSSADRQFSILESPLFIGTWANLLFFAVNSSTSLH